MSRVETSQGAWAMDDGGIRVAARALVVALVILAPLGLGGGWHVYSTWRVQEDGRVAKAKLDRAHADLVTLPSLGMLPVAEAAHGRDLYMGICAVCHAPDAKGMRGLGKDLTASNFVASKTDEELKQFLITGRPEAKPMGMPPRGGRDDLTDDDIGHVVMYVRGVQDGRRMPELPAMAAMAGPSEAEKAAALDAAGGDAELAGYIASGNKLFHSTCVACHGKGGVGIKGNGKALVGNEFIGSLDDDKLLAFIKQGRSPSDPKSTTGIQMPPKGGNPAMTDDDLLDVISYLRTLQPKAGAAPKTP